MREAENHVEEGVQVFEVVQLAGDLDELFDYFCTALRLGLLKYGPNHPEHFQIVDVLEVFHGLIFAFGWKWLTEGLKHWFDLSAEGMISVVILFISEVTRLSQNSITISINLSTDNMKLVHTRVNTVE